MLDLLELAEFTHYLFGFWLFLFSSRFRAHVIAIWRRRRWFLQLLVPVEIFVSTFCGLCPLALIWSAFYP